MAYKLFIKPKMNTKPQRNLCEPALRLVCVIGVCSNGVNRLSNLRHVFIFEASLCKKHSWCRQNGNVCKGKGDLSLIPQNESMLLLGHQELRDRRGWLFGEQYLPFY